MNMRVVFRSPAQTLPHSARACELRNLLLIATVTGMAFAASDAHATIFCVNTAAQIQAVLSFAQNNNESDEVRIVGGTYSLGTGLSFATNQPGSISIRGGYSPACSAFTGAPTILDGQQVVRPLVVSSIGANIRIEGLTLVSGQISGGYGSGLLVISDSGSVRIDRNILYANHATLGGHALHVEVDDSLLLVRNNLVFANTSNVSGAVFLQSQVNGQTYVVGNTIVANSGEGDLDAGGLVLFGGAHFALTNNIIWGNTADGMANDLSSYGSATHSRIANDIGVVQSGTVATLIVNEQSVNPDFATCAGFLCINFELDRASPLIDAGNDAPAGGMTSLDLAGKPRILGARVDIGAFEFDVIYIDGFD